MSATSEAIRLIAYGIYSGHLAPNRPVLDKPYLQAKQADAGFGAGFEDFLMQPRLPNYSGLCDYYLFW